MRLAGAELWGGEHVPQGSPREERGRQAPREEAHREGGCGSLGGGTSGLHCCVSRLCRKHSPLGG